MSKKYLDGPMGQVHVTDTGQGPSIVLLHQTAWSGLQFVNAIPYLVSSGFRCIAVDTPGFGMSDGPESPPSIEEYAESLFQILTQMGLEEVMVLGHHTGASIATAFARAYPSMVKHLFLHGVPIYTKSEQKERLLRPHFDQSPQADGSHLTKRWSTGVNICGGKASLDAIHWSLINFFTAGSKEWFGHHAAFTYDIETDLKSLNVPATVISNSGDILHKKMVILKGLRPDFKFCELDGGTFHVIFEEPERWSRLVSRELNEVLI
jgi:pimeloyl-ACP methyl ester carboxylesterase